MEEVNISETESRYFGDLFLCCDVEKTGKVPVLKATEMFRSANLSNDVLRQMTSIAGIPQTAIHMTRSQFYSCLKLIAAYQAGISLRQELLTNFVALPLPKFSWKDSPTQQIDYHHPTTTNDLNNGGGGGGRDDDVHWLKPSNLTTTIPRRSPNLIELARDPRNDMTNNSDITSTDSEVEHNDAEAEKRTRRGSPEAWSTASDSPTPTNSVTERPWAKNSLWQGLLCEEQRQLLGTEEESSDRHSSEEDNENDLETIYQITPEQREYYLTQFRAVQPDQNGVLSGPVARVFFEKSRIPVEELRHIWQLCDVTKDGALSLAEFTAAMHLVVLRRNNIPLPPILPTCLMPTVIQSTVNVMQQQQPPQLPPSQSQATVLLAEADLLHLDDENTGSNEELIKTTKEKVIRRIGSLQQEPSQQSIDNYSSQLQQSQSNSSKINHNSSATVSNSSPSIQSTTSQSNSCKNKSESSSPPPSHHNIAAAAVVGDGSPKQLKDGDWINQSKEWTKFTESPTSNVSSPGPKPVNFDMQRTAQAVVSDPQILHPVPLRVTPIGVDILDDETIQRINQRKSETIAFDSSVALRESESSPKQQQQISNAQHRDSLQNDLRAIQRPQPKKLSIAKNVGAIPPPPQREAASISMIESTTNDLNSLTINSTGNYSLINKKEPPPLPPPRPHKHARSSSLDLNKLKLNAPMPPEVPPRVSPQIVTQQSLDATTQMAVAAADVTDSTFADFAHFPDSVIEASNIRNNNNNVKLKPESDEIGLQSLSSTSGRHAIIPSLQSSLRSSAFEVYRKPTPREFQSPERINEYEKRVSSINETLRIAATVKQERNLPDVMHHLKEQNILLLRICNDLSDELLRVQRKREDIKYKLDIASGGGGGGGIGTAAAAAGSSGSGISSGLSSTTTSQHHSIV